MKLTSSTLAPKCLVTGVALLARAVSWSRKGPAPHRQVTNGVLAEPSLVMILPRIMTLHSGYLRPCQAWKQILDSGKTKFVSVSGYRPSNW